ncbi:MAG: redoxin domain-containing protein [Pseudomonadota bacterium]
MRIVISLLALCASVAHGLQPGQMAGDFRLFDQAGGSHHLHYFTDKKAVVLLVQDLQCKASLKAEQQVSKLADRFGADVQVFAVNSTSAREDVTAQSADLPVLVDDVQLVGRTYGLNQAGEVLVIDPDTWQVVYRGNAGKSLEAALANVVRDQAVAKPQTRVKGCDITYQPLDGEAVSYAETVAPLLAENCVSCHKPGGIGPWAMTDYNMVRGFSIMIREVLMTQRMPPWHADPTVGHFANDRSMSRDELQTLVSWIDAGAPRGAGKDPLPSLATPSSVWGPLGEPDLIIDIPPTDVPATGVVDYKYKYVKNPLDKDVWVRASQIVPGERAVLHHVITRFGQLVTEGRRKGRISNRGIGGGLAGYVPGAEARPLPEGTGTFLPAGSTIEFQMHYTTSGVAATDHSRIGIYFHEEPPEHRYKGMVLADPRIRIPPHANNHAEDVARAFKTDVLVYSMLPHSHYRGKAAKFIAEYPDGSSEVLLNVPNYDFNWQTTYRLEQPKFMPAGTRIVYTNWWDNSAQNLANPDPNKEVRWGQQSFEEMIFGVVSYRELKAEESGQMAGGQ